MEFDIQVYSVIGFLVLYLLALISNVILILLARKLAAERSEMKLVTGLAIIDMFLSIINAVVSLKFLFTKEIISDKWCTFKGPADSLGLFFSMLLVSLIALERSSQIFLFDFSRLSGACLIAYSCTYTVVIVLTAYKGEFHPLPNVIYCFPTASSSILSVISIFLQGFSLFACVVITVICYFRILVFVTQARYPNNPNFQNPWLNKLPVITRTLVISFSYMILVIPACILIIFEAILPPNHTISLVIDICLASLALFNPCLVLFMHSAIYQLFSEYVSRFIAKWYPFYYHKSKELA